MPAYDYTCLSCDFAGELRHKINEEVTCPKCGGELRKVYTKVAPVHFIGSGFYVTDTPSSKKSAL